MRTMLALLFGGSDRPIDRVTYLRLGVALMLLKYVVDAALIGVIGRRVPDAGRLPAAHAHVQRKEFKTGLAYPLRARLVGAGVGAVRHCEFTTGAFVEPITVWDAPHRLAFDVIASRRRYRSGVLLARRRRAPRRLLPHVARRVQTHCARGRTDTARRPYLVHPRHASGDVLDGDRRHHPARYPHAGAGARQARGRVVLHFERQPPIKSFSRRDRRSGDFVVEGPKFADVPTFL